MNMSDYLLYAGVGDVFLVVTLLVLLLFFIVKGFAKTERQIKCSIEPKSLDILPSAKNMIDLAVELWKLDKRMKNISGKLSDDEKKLLGNSLDRLKRFLQVNDIKTEDYEGLVYNEGMNVKVMHVEKEHNVPRSIIGETIKPAIGRKGVLVSQAEVVIYEK